MPLKLFAEHLKLTWLQLKKYLKRLECLTTPRKPRSSIFRLNQVRMIHQCKLTMILKFKLLINQLLRHHQFKLQYRTLSL